jgi:hypothetical protein
VVRYRIEQLEAQVGFNKHSDQLEAVSDSFALGTGAEPTTSHQNQFSAAGQIVRNLQELTRHER